MRSCTKVDEGNSVKLDDNAIEVVEDGNRRWLAVDGRTEPILALPTW